MEVVMIELSQWAFLEEFFLQIVFFVILPMLVAISFHKKKHFKTIIIISGIIAFFVVLGIIGAHQNDYNYINDVKNNAIISGEFFVQEVNLGRQIDYFVIDGTSYIALSKKRHDFMEETFEGHLCEVEYYETSRRIIRVKVID